MLSLSTEAAPHLSLAELDAACRARGLDGQELVLAGQGVPPSEGRIVAIRTETLDAETAPAIARLAARLGVPVSVPARAIAPDALAPIADAFTRAGSQLLLGCPTNLEAVLRVLACGVATIGIAWEVDPATDLGDAGAFLLAAGERLGIVRLHGGGPEQREQDGRGIGPLVVDLALSGYAGPIVLCPSSPAQVARWTSWLAARGSSGCGHAVSAQRSELDVRPVEPRDRLAAILGAYGRLIPGATLHVTVDHDPQCMYYMLEATEPAGSFAFQIVEDGPETWRAEVTKR